MKCWTLSKGNATDKPSWLTSEVGAGMAFRQSIELWRAAWRRGWLTLLLSLSLGLAIAAAGLFGQREYAPRFVLRVVEADRTPGNLPPPQRHLAEYVRQAVFTSQPLFEVMRRHGLYASLMRRNARSALESFKEDILIEVYQNYFVEERTAGDLPRSARLTVGFRAKDPNLALAVTRDLGALVVRHELAARRERASAAATNASRARDSLVSALQRRYGEVRALQGTLGEDAGVPDPRQQVELVSLLGSLAAIERQVDLAERRATTSDVGAALERRGIGMYFQVVDDGSLPGRAGQVANAWLAGGATFLLGLPLVALAMGAFYPVKRGQA
jgi:hypothetical protein